ncbi:MAG: 30S ribosomal protein S2 [Rickettsiales bacterium]|nr:30S ribosomal protein S2 [Rickettsiales bacterium]
MMALPQFTMRELIEAGVHFGHKTRRWNPRMAPFIYGVRNDTHIIDLGKTVPLLQNALTALREVAAANGKVLFVGTKRQASEFVQEAAIKCNQYYINQRWLGGMMTNWNTIQNSIKRLNQIEDRLGGTQKGLTKKEVLMMERQRDKLLSSLGGIRKMNGRPNMLFIVDVTKEDLAVLEARKLGIPIVAIVDTNASIDGIDYPIPGNDDAARAIRLYCQLAADAVIDGRESAGLTTEKFEFTREMVVEDEPAVEKEDESKIKATTKKASMAEAAKKAAEATKAKPKGKKAEKPLLADEGSAPESDEAA